jgi:predicted membrane chloride channel (bestrophin family)
LAKKYTADRITPVEIQAVIRKSEAYPSADFYEGKKAVMQLVSDGFLLKREDRSQKDLSNSDRNPVKFTEYTGNISQVFKSGQRSRQKTRQMARFSTTQAAQRLIAAAITETRLMPSSGKYTKQLNYNYLNDLLAIR